MEGSLTAYQSVHTSAAKEKTQGPANSGRKETLRENQGAAGIAHCQKNPRHFEFEENTVASGDKAQLVVYRPEDSGEG
ncbi:hypothetical protein CC2G_007660 [Coprinopsis cinerea AmutBmut pab1-1]|nr:hypothetical protein CC2G_007660 [Coprinopsis cinerea AmutBmut pab1-1]